MKDYKYIVKKGIDDLISLSPYFGEWNLYSPSRQILEIDSNFEKEEYYEPNNRLYKQIAKDLNTAYINKLTEEGSYGEEVEMTLSLNHNPIFDAPNSSIIPGVSFESHRLVFLNFGNEEDTLKKMFIEGKPKGFKLIDNSWETTPNYLKEQDRQGGFFIPSVFPTEEIKARIEELRNNPSILPEGIRENPLTPDECYNKEYTKEGPIGMSGGPGNSGIHIPDNTKNGMESGDRVKYPKDWTVRLEVPEEVDIDTVINDHLNKNPKEKEMWKKGELRLDLVRNGELFITCMYNRFKNED